MPQRINWTAVAATAAVAAILVALWQFSVVRQDDLGTQVEATRTELGQDIEDVRTELGQDIEDIRTELGREIENLRTELGQEIEKVRTELGREIESLRTARRFRDPVQPLSERRALRG